MASDHAGLTPEEKAHMKELEAELAATKIVEPNKDERDTKLDRLKKQIEALYSTMNEVRAQEDTERAEKDKIRKEIRAKVREAEPVNERQTMLARIKDLSEEINRRYSEIGEHRNAMKKIDDDRKAVRELLPQGTFSRDFKSAEDVDVEIKRLEFSLETEGSGLKREKRLMQQIRELQALKASLKNKDAVQANLDALNSQFKERIASREENVKSLEQLKQEREDLRSKLDNLKNARDAREQELMKDLPGGGSGQSDKRKTLHSQITKLKDEQRTIREQFDKERDRYFEWKKKHQTYENLKWKDEQARRNEDRRKRDDERNKRNEERRKQRMETEKVRRLNPKEEEIQMCINLTNELRAHLKAKKEEKKVVDFDASSAAPSQYQVLKKDAEDDWLYGDRTKKKAAAKPAAAPKPVAKEAKEALPAKQKSLNLSMQSRRAFELVGIAVPRYTSEIQASIEELAKKKIEFEGQKRSEAEVDAELKAEWDAEELKRQQQAEANAADEGEASPNDSHGRRGRSGGRGARGGRGGRGYRGGRGGDSNEEQNGAASPDEEPPAADE